LALSAFAWARSYGDAYGLENAVAGGRYWYLSSVMGSLEISTAPHYPFECHAARPRGVSSFVPQLDTRLLPSKWDVAGARFQSGSVDIIVGVGYVVDKGARNRTDSPGDAALGPDGRRAFDGRVLTSQMLAFARPQPYLKFQSIACSRLVVPYWLPTGMLAGADLVLVTFLVARRSTRSRRRAGCCLFCGYNLRGTSAALCSECGRPRRLDAECRMPKT
jgi:hypothetical protein